MKVPTDSALPVVNKVYDVTYKNEYDQIEALHGLLVHPDLSGFTVLNVDNKSVLILKERVFLLRESDVKGSEAPALTDSQAAGDKAQKP